MKLPKRLYYPLPEAAEKLGCTIRDLYHFASTGAIDISVFIPEHSVGNCEVYFLEGFKDNKRNGLIFQDGKTINLEKKIDDRLYIANFIAGFFYVNKKAFSDIEFKHNNIISSPTLYFYPDRLGGGLEITLEGENLKPFDIDVDYLCVIADDLNNVKDEGSFRNLTEDNPKRAAKRNEVIYSLIKLIPEMGDVDLDTESLPKIADLIDSIAASRGIEFPKTHWQTWQKYLGRESQQKRKK